MEEKVYNFYTDKDHQQVLYEAISQMLVSPLGYVFIGLSYNPGSRQQVKGYSWTSDDLKNTGIQKQYILDLKLNEKNVDKLIYFDPGMLPDPEKTFPVLLNFRYARFIAIDNPAYSLIAKEFVKQEFKSIMNFSRWKKMSHSSIYIDMQKGKFLLEKN